NGTYSSLPGAGSGLAFVNAGPPLRGLSRWYGVSGDKQTLDLARGLVNFLLKPSMWRTREAPPMVVAEESGLWTGHFHGHCMAMMGLLEYGIVAKDNSVKEFVANFYNYGKKY